MEILSFEKWTTKNRPMIIAGACSAETEEQLLETCQQIAQNGGVSMLRAGIWKPRTRPGAFEGVGEIGLKWLAKAKKSTNLPICTEVAKPEHVELALKYGVDMLWIGARSTVNPFTVQEIADALQGVKIPVMIKNPINPDLGLWIGAIERIYRAGISQIAALHRGFSSYQKTQYRNQPLWQIPIKLKSEIPEIPLFCDPSHIGGNPDLIQAIAQKALDLNYDGLMIETHRQPKEAWSDAQQQITPQRLSEILENLHSRKPSTDDEDFSTSLEDLRQKVDRSDHEIIQALSDRMKLVHQIGEFKNDNNVAIFQLERWIEISKTRPKWAKDLGLSEELITKIYQLIHQESIAMQGKQFS